MEKTLPLTCETGSNTITRKVLLDMVRIMFDEEQGSASCGLRELADVLVELDEHLNANPCDHHLAN